MKELNNYLIESILFPDLKKRPWDENSSSLYNFHSQQEIDLLAGDENYIFFSDDEHDEHSDDWLQGKFINPGDALQAYVWAYVYEIQERFRLGKPTSKDLQYLDLMKKLSVKKKISHPIYRVIDSRSLKSDLNVGDIIKDSGFCSCSSDPRGIYEYIYQSNSREKYWLFIINTPNPVEYIDVIKSAKEEKVMDFIVKKFASQYEYIILPTTEMKVVNMQDSYLKSNKRIKKIFEVDMIQY